MGELSINELLDGKPPEAVTKAERTFGKTKVLAGVYGAGPNTWLQQFARVRDPMTGERRFARIDFKQAKAARANFLRTYPELPRWWDREVAAWRAGGEIRSMLHGRLMRLRDLRGGFGDEGEGLSEIVNGAILMTEGDIAGGNGASYKAMRGIGWPWWGDGRGMGGAGLLLHVHDALYAEAGQDRTEEAKAALRAAMETTLEWGGRTVRITATPKAGPRWSDLG